jgi:dTDP-4-dehydrorhamnose reductase
MQPRLFIVGATGFVGSRLSAAARAHFEVVEGSRAPRSAGGVAIDIADAQSVRAAFDQARPDFVVHLAAMSDIDRAEREPQLAEAINVDGAVNVARECQRQNARMLYTSTDAVFDGAKGIYYEDDPPTPLNRYGRTKAQAEARVRELLPSALVVRPSLVLGRSASGGGNSYLEKVIGNLQAGNEIISPTYEFRNPIDVGTLCQFLLELIPARQSTGIVQIGATDKVSRYDLARAIAEYFGFDARLIVAQQAPVPGRAPRGRDDFLVTERLRALCSAPVPTCREVIERACALF